MNKYIITIDLGGTTFSSYVIDQKIVIMGKSEIYKVANYSSTDELFEGINDQIMKLLYNVNLTLKDIYCIAISAPGPLDSNKGVIFETPNLLLMQNINIVQIMNNRYNIPVFLENDANLFAFGEWYSTYKKSRIMIGITLGTGLGLGVVINKQLFTGSNGMGAEYGISPYKNGVWEDLISIEGLEKMIFKQMSKNLSPKELYHLALDNNAQALNIWNLFGKELGLFTSHVINMLDPSVISFGGGISNAYSVFSESLKNQVKIYSPSYEYNKITITSSKTQLDSTHVGSALNALKLIF